MDERDDERNDKPDVCADPKQMTLSKLLEIDKEQCKDEEDEHQKQMSDLSFEEEPSWSRGHLRQSKANPIRGEVSSKTSILLAAVRW